MTERTKTILGAAAIIAVGAALRIPYLAYDVINMDETIYATIARAILRGEIPYRDVWEIKPPLVFYLYALIFRVFGDGNLTAVQVAAMISVILTALVTADIARKAWGGEAGLLAGLGVAAYSTCGWVFDMQAADTEIFLILPLMISARILLFADGRAAYAKLFAAGVFASLAILFKQPAGAAAVMMAAWIFFNPPAGKNRFAALAVYAAGGCLPVFAMFGYFAAHGAFKDLLDLMIFNNFKYIAERGESSALFTMFDSSLMLAVPNLILWSAGFGWAGAVVVGRIRGRTADSSGKHALFAALFLFSCAVAVYSGVQLNGHYYLMMLPALCLMWARLFTFLMERYKGAGFRELRPAVIGLFVAGMILPLVYYHLYAGRSTIAKEIVPNNAFESKLGADIKAMTGPDDAIFVWGLDPQVYYFSGRKPAGRFVYTTFFQMGLVVDSPESANDSFVNRESWRLLMEDLAKYKPKLFLDSAGFFTWTEKHTVERYPQLHRWLNENYDPYFEFAGYKIYSRRD